MDNIDKLIIISKAEYEDYIETQTRLEIVKEYIQIDSYPSVDTIRVMLGIDKTS